MFKFITNNCIVNIAINPTKKKIDNNKEKEGEESE